MLKGLSRDYWPSDAGAPFIRVVLALFGAPVIVVPLILLVLILADYAIDGNLETARQKASAVAPFLLIVSYAVTLTLGLLAFLLLWSLRLRGRLAYWIAGCIVGVTAALLAPLIGGPAITPVSGVTMALYFGCVLLAMRWILRLSASSAPR